MPAKSKAQFRAMAAAAKAPEGSTAIDIDPKKAKEYLTKVRYSKLPEKTKTKSKD